jgi:hypothetical protein
MGREGKVASPALRGNANPRLMRHKSIFTTLSKQTDTHRSRYCILAGRRRGPRRRAHSRPWPSPGSPPGAPSGPAGRHRPGRLPGRVSVSTSQCAGHSDVNPQRARAARREAAAMAREGAPRDGAPDARARTGRRALPGHPRGMRAYQTGTSPQPTGCTSLTAGAPPRPGGPSRERERAGAAARRWRRPRRRGRARL